MATAIRKMLAWSFKIMTKVNVSKKLQNAVVSQFNGTSTPKGSYSAKTRDNDCNVNSSRYSLSTALCESNSLSGQVWTKCPTGPDTQGRHVEAALIPPLQNASYHCCSVRLMLVKLCRLLTPKIRWPIGRISSKILSNIGFPGQTRSSIKRG